MRKSRFLNWGMILFVLSVLTFFGVQDSQAAEAKPLKIGYIGDWTGPVASQLGILGNAVIGYFHEYVNKEKGGIPYLDPKTGKEKGKVKVMVLYADTQYQLPLIRSAYRDMVDKGVLAVISGLTPATEGLKKEYERDKIPCLSSTNVVGAVWPPGWIYTKDWTFVDATGMMLNFIKENWKESRPPRVAFVFADAGFARSMLIGTPEYAKSIGIEIVAQEPIPFQAVDATGQLLRIKAAKADWIVSVQITPEAALMMKDINRLGMDIKVIFMGPDDIALIKAAGKAGEGMYNIEPLPSATEEDRPEIKALNHRYRTMFKPEAGYEIDGIAYPQNTFYAGWRSAAVVEEAIRLALQKKAPDKLTGADVRELGFNRVKDFMCDGLYNMVGGITYQGGKDHRGCTAGVIRQLKDGKWRSIQVVKAPLILPPGMKQ